MSAFWASVRAAGDFGPPLEVFDFFQERFEPGDFGFDPGRLVVGHQDRKDFIEGGHELLIALKDRVKILWLIWVGPHLFDERLELIGQGSFLDRIESGTDCLRPGLVVGFIAFFELLSESKEFFRELAEQDGVFFLLGLSPFAEKHPG